MSGKVLEIRKVGDPILSKIAENVDIKNITQETLDTIQDLKATLEYGSGFGIAAPQIGVSKRIIVIGAKKENVSYNGAEDIPITIMINPKWSKEYDQTDLQYEGCMSIPEIRGKVRRYTNIKIEYYNESGKKITKRVNGFFARLIQHECDHLDGIVFLEKVKKTQDFATIANIKKYKLRQNKSI